MSICAYSSLQTSMAISDKNRHIWRNQCMAGIAEDGRVVTTAVELVVLGDAAFGTR